MAKLDGTACPAARRIVPRDAGCNIHGTVARPPGQGRRYVAVWNTVGELVSENYFGQIQTWCREHNVLSGGHLLNGATGESAARRVENVFDSVSSALYAANRDFAYATVCTSCRLSQRSCLATLYQAVSADSASG